MNQYSQHIKRTALEKIQGPFGKSISEVSNEMGINQGTLYVWLKRSESGDVSPNKRRKSGRNKMRFQEKFRIVLEYEALKESARGQWLREKGYREDQIKLWEKEIETFLKQAETKDSKVTEKELRDTKKELVRKEKALAEVSALLVLKKKVDLLLNRDSER